MSQGVPIPLGDMPILKKLSLRFPLKVVAEKWDVNTQSLSHFFSRNDVDIVNFRLLTRARYIRLFMRHMTHQEMAIALNTSRRTIERIIKSKINET